MDDATKKMLHDQIVTAVDVRDQTAYGRAQRDLPPLDVHVCLGPGRCMFPRSGADTRVCAYCLTVRPKDSAKDVDTIAAKFFKGN